MAGSPVERKTADMIEQIRLITNEVADVGIVLTSYQIREILRNSATVLIILDKILGRDKSGAPGQET
jgi:hypothetical protein